jgi:hypothetical protein
MTVPWASMGAVIYLSKKPKDSEGEYKTINLIGCLSL